MGETKVIKVGEQPTTLVLSKCKLVVLEGPDEGRELTVDRGTITVGNHKDCDLFLKDDTVSRNHAEIKKTKDGYLLHDLGSTNGTFVDSLRVREIFISTGSVIRFGKTKVKFIPQDEKIEIYPSKRDKYGSIIGKSLEMRKIYGIIEKVAPTNVSVIIEGETGTGKEMIAEALHANSKRANKPFVVFDCSAVQENLIESGLFGHERGSFTGATATRAGAFEMANGGTIFLDELAELNIELQPKLLRALEQGQIKRVGADVPRKVDVRVVAATNRNLKKEVKQKRFREDLFFRISVVQLYVPPLRRRTDDIDILMTHFLEKHNKGLEKGSGAKTISEEARKFIREYHWPGNVRELRNVVERAASLCETDIIGVDDLPEYLKEKSVITTSPRIRGDIPFKQAKEEWLESFEKDYLIDLLRRNNLNISKAAKQAGIDRKSVQRLLKKYDLNVKDIS